MNTEICDVSLNYNEEVLVDFFKFQINVRQHTKWLFILASLVAIAAGAVLWFVVKIPAVGIACMVIGLVIVVNYPMQMHRAIKRQNFKALFRPNQRLKVNKESLVQYDPKAELTYEWTKIIEAAETKKYIYLYSSKYGALIIQKCEINDDVINNIKDVLKEKDIKLKKYLYHK